MLYFTTQEGKISKINVFALLTFIVGLVDIWKPFLPAEYVIYLVPAIAAVNFALRTFFPQSGEVLK